MAIMYPDNLPLDIEKYLRGEAKVFEALKAQLDNTWIVYHNVSWHQSSNIQSRQRDGEIDFIISHPDYGFLVLEVKGGFQIVYHPENDSWVSINDGMEAYDIKNPYDQARNNKYAFLKNLGTIKDLSNYSSEILEEAINVGYGVVFPDVSRVSAGNLPIYANLEITLFTHDIENNLSRKLIRVFEYYSKGKSVNKSLMSRAHSLLREILAPTFILDRSLKYWIKEEQERILQLTDTQFRFINIIQMLKQASIYGCAGSGKTLIAVKKTTLCAESGLKTLLVCYNNILGQHLKSYFNNPLITADNFHSVLDDLLYLTPDNHLDDNALQELVCSTDLPMYDCIIIDEAQDFTFIQLEILKYLLKEDGLIYYFWDSNQKIIRSEDYIPKNIPCLTLTTNLRNTEHIFNEVKTHYSQAYALDHQGPSGRTVEKLEPYKHDDPHELYLKLRKIINKLISIEMLKPEDIVILTFKATKKSCLIDFTCDYPTKIFGDEPKPQAIKIDSVRRFKGMESKVVIVTEMDDDLSMQKPELFEDMCYVSFSRAVHHLIILPPDNIYIK